MKKLILTYITKVERADHTEIILFCRDATGKRHIIRVSDFSPYFYVPVREVHKLSNCKYVKEIVPSDRRSIDGERIVKVICKRAEDVPKVRSLVSKAYEADVAFVCRFLIDKNIKHGIIVKRLAPCLSSDEIIGW